MLRIVRNNLGLKALALALAIVGWAYFRFAGAPTAAAPQFQQLSIPISTMNLALGYVARFADQQAVVTVATKRGEPAVKPEEIKAVLDLSGKGAGAYNVPVRLVAPDVVVQSLSPASITLTIERIEERAFPIGIQYIGAGRIAVVVSAAAAQPESALVQAPASLLAQVARVQTDVAVPAQPGTLDEMVRPAAVDASGAPVPGTTITPNLVRVRVQFAAGAGPKK